MLEKIRYSIKIDGGIIENAYIGGENDPGVTGTIDKVDFAILDGSITNLLPGVSAGTSIIVEQENYRAVLVEGTVENKEIGERKVEIKYVFNIIEDSIKVNKDKTVKLETKITTTPAGYEYLFIDEKIEWETLNSDIATVDGSGNVTGIKGGNATISADLLESQDTIQIEVLDASILILVLVIIFGIFALIIWGYIIFSSIII